MTYNFSMKSIVKITFWQHPFFVDFNLIRNPRATGLLVVRLSSVTLIRQSWFTYLFREYLHMVQTTEMWNNKNVPSNVIKKWEIILLIPDFPYKTTHKELCVQKQNGLLLRFLLAL